MSKRDFDLNEEVLEMLLNGKMRPHEDILLIEPIEYNTIGRFIVPTKNTDKDMHTQSIQGKVRAAGKGKVNSLGHFVENDIKVGDIVLLKRGACMHQAVQDKTWLITRADEVDALIEDELP